MFIDTATLLDHDLSARVRRKTSARILPAALILFVLSFLARVNLSYAAFDMNRDLGLQPSVYRLGAGIFFAGYLLFEIPAAWVIDRYGARLCLGLMMIGWGIAATCMGAIRGVAGFYALRVLLGVAQAGFFPGIILYLRRGFQRRT